MNRPLFLPFQDRPIESDAVRCAGQACEPVLHIVTQGSIMRELGSFGVTCH